ncbi:ATP synthase F1 subunit epsilon [Clostridium sp. BJN0001]|uniref:ATP synthase F1 subunit epsilon n=1 Tax=Clostridium sp. BJN0001 TaxID=2930219 RepID=UPI001FD3EE97|nr:ATP synthase F1 subunit epsilon [Clostridium sp. BJN0001]
MSDTFELNIITPRKDVFSGRVKRIFLNGSNGNFEILPQHAPMIAATVPYVVKFEDEEGKFVKLFVSSGIVNVENDRVVLSTDAAEFPKDIDFKRAEKAKDRALKRLEEPDKYDVKIFKLALLRANERLKLKDE